MAMVIAECCQNHNGDRTLLKEMIWAAAQCGADYAKIQTMFAEDLTSRERFETMRPYQAEYERLQRLEIPTEEYAWFIEACRTAGIKPLTTVFSQARVAEVAKFPWSEVKVASYDCASFPLLRLLKRHFRHLFVSTGATHDQEIAEAARVLDGVSFSFLHCVTIYPTPLEQVHLARLQWLRQWTPSVGFSDHTTAQQGIRACAVALLLGAEVVERHFTLLRPDQTKDGPISIGPKPLSQLVELAHGSQDVRARYVQQEVGDYQAMIGQASRALSETELLNRDYYRGRFASRTADGRLVDNWEEYADRVAVPTHSESGTR